jgi:hypothetical protein
VTVKVVCPDGKYLALSRSGDGRFSLWRPQTKMDGGERDIKTICDQPRTEGAMMGLAESSELGMASKLTLPA